MIMIKRILNVYLIIFMTTLITGYRSYHVCPCYRFTNVCPVAVIYFVPWLLWLRQYHCISDDYGCLGYGIYESVCGFRCNHNFKDYEM